MTKIALSLVIIGALNWLLVGLFDGLNLVDKIAGGLTFFSRSIYILVGAAGLYCISLLFNNCLCSKPQRVAK
ncbi:MAG: hypothetical protein RLZ12_301 [Bacillota bacterium]|jgi:uncharacterized membrane protein YuzA (DUF378 family)